MKSVRLFDYLQYDGQSWQVVAQDGTVLALKNLVTGRIRKVGVSELLGDDSYLPDSPDVLPNLDDVAVLERLDPVAKGRAELLHRHVVEVLTGRVPADDEDEVAGVMRLEYAPERPLADRIGAKLAELSGLGISLTERTFTRYIAAYRAEGVAGLVDGRRLRKSTSTGRLDPELVGLLKKAIGRQANLSTGTKSRLIRQVTVEAHELGLQVPAPSTLYRVLRNLEGSRHPFGNATTRRTQANRPDRTWGKQFPARPGELIEMDSSPLDVMLVYPDGSTGKAELSVAMDIATRTLCSAILRPVATKGVDAAVLLARAITPLPIQPGWLASLAFTRSILPAAIVPDDEHLRAAIAAKPVIVPESITVDRGNIYIGSTFMNACERLQISVTKANSRTPTDKPHVERIFAAINSGFTQYLAGYVGPNVVKRGKTPEKDAYWTMAEVQNLLDLWIVLHWQNRPHSGLRHPAMPRQDLSPNEAHAALTSVAPSVNVTLGRDDYIAMLPVDYRSIQDYGINFENLVYDSRALHEHRGQKSGLPEPAGGRWEIRYDPYRMQSIFVRDHRKGKWIEAAWTMTKQTLAPFSLDVLRAALKVVDRRTGAVPGVDVLAEINRIQTNGAKTVKEKKAAKRDSVNKPIVPALSAMRDRDAADLVHEESAAGPGADAGKRRAARRIDDDEEED